MSGDCQPPCHMRTRSVGRRETILYPPLSSGSAGCCLTWTRQLRSSGYAHRSLQLHQRYFHCDEGKRDQTDRRASSTDQRNTRHRSILSRPDAWAAAANRQTQANLLLLCYLLGFCAPEVAEECHRGSSSFERWRTCCPQVPIRGGWLKSRVRSYVEQLKLLLHGSWLVQNHLRGKRAFREATR